MGDRLRAGIPSRYVTSQLGQLSLASLWGRLIESSFGRGKGGNSTSAGWQVTLCDPMWHVSSRSGVATLRTAIHLLLTYLLTYSRLNTAVWSVFHVPAFASLAKLDDDWSVMRLPVFAN